MERGAFRRGKHSYGLVLVLVVVSVIFQVAAPETEGVQLVTVALAAATLVASVHISGAYRRFIRVGAAVAALAAGSAAVSLVVRGHVPDAEAAVANVLLVALTPVVVAAGVTRQVRSEGEVTIHTLGGVLAIYLLIGMAFSFLYSAVDHIEPGELFAQTSDPTRSDELYFSFTTLATVGFGDFTARTELGRTVAVTEGLLGQIYLVTVVALIVANLGGRRPR